MSRLQCHIGETYDAYEHHFHQTEVDGEPSDGALCIKCHMPEQVYMGVDWRADHSIRVPRPDLTQEIGVPNACGQSGCHDDQTVEWSADAYTNWYGTSRKPHFGTVFAAARNGDPAAEEGLHALVEDELHPVIVRATAINELQAFPGERTDRVMRQALTNEEILIRLTAVTAISANSPENLAETLGPMLFDTAHAVRIMAASRLSGVGRELLKPHQRPVFDKALAEHVAANERNLDFAASGMNLANLYSQQGDATSAERYYRMALDVDDLFFPAKQNLAVMVSQQGRNDEAEQLLREILTDYPEQYDSAYSLALLLVGVGRVEEGLGVTYTIAERNAAGSASVSTPVDFRSARQASFAMNAPVSSSLAIRRSRMPERSRIHYNHGLLLAQLLRDEEAEAALHRALGLEPESFDYLYAMADFLYKRDRFEDALAIAERMIEAYPAQPVGHEIKAAIENRQ